MPIIATDEDTGEEIVIDTVDIVQAPDFKEIYVTGTMGGAFGPYDLRMTFYDSKIEKKIEKKNKKLVERRDVKGSVIMPFAAAKQLSLWLEKQLTEYEQRAGHEIFIGSQDDPRKPKA